MIFIFYLVSEIFPPGQTKRVAELIPTPSRVLLCADNDQNASRLTISAPFCKLTFARLRSIL